MGTLIEQRRVRQEDTDSEGMMVQVRSDAIATEGRGFSDDDVDDDDESTGGGCSGGKSVFGASSCSGESSSIAFSSGSGDVYSKLYQDAHIRRFRQASREVAGRTAGPKAWLHAGMGWRQMG